MSEEKITLGAKTTQQMTCANCGKTIPQGKHYTFKGAKGKEVYFCEDCKKQMDDAYTAETQNINMASALIGGLVAAIVAGFIWYQIVILSGVEIGYGAIGVGWLIGYGVYRGASRKRGLPLQLVSVGLTLAALIIAEYFIFTHFGEQYILQETGQKITLPITFVLENALSDFISSIISPIGLLIWGIGLYVAGSVAKPRKV